MLDKTENPREPDTTNNNDSTQVRIFNVWYHTKLSATESEPIQTTCKRKAPSDTRPAKRQQINKTISNVNNSTNSSPVAEEDSPLSEIILNERMNRLRQLLKRKSENNKQVIEVLWSQDSSLQDWFLGKLVNLRTETGNQRKVSLGKSYCLISNSS